MSARFQHIMVPLDFTEKNLAAVEMALDLARQHQSRVTLFHVIERIDYADDEGISKFYGLLKKQAEGQLAPHVQRFRNAGVSVSEEIILGKRGPDIVSYSTRDDVDLVVLSSHRVDPGKGSKSWATLSYQIAILCPCPVLLVK